jgi:hypothetical protein
MPSAGFQPATPAKKRPQTYALDRAATEVGPDETIAEQSEGETLERT